MFKQFQFLKNKLVPFLVDGGTVIDTDVTTSALKPAVQLNAPNRRWVFFTSIGPAGDVVIKVPPTSIYLNNDNSLWQADYHRHLARVQQFIEGFQGVNGFANKLSTGCGALPGLALLLSDKVREGLLAIQEGNVWGIVYLLVQIGLPLLMRRYKGIIISSLVSWFANSFIKKKLKAPVKS